MPISPGVPANLNKFPMGNYLVISPFVIAEGPILLTRTHMESGWPNVALEEMRQDNEYPQGMLDVIDGIFRDSCVDGAVLYQSEINMVKYQNEQGIWRAAAVFTMSRVGCTYDSPLFCAAIQAIPQIWKQVSAIG